MDNATLTSIISNTFSGLLVLLLGLIAWFFARYIKHNDEKHAMHFTEQKELRKESNKLRGEFNWLLGRLDGRGCIDSGEKPCLDDDSTDPVKERQRVLDERSRRRTDHRHASREVEVQ